MESCGREEPSRRGPCPLRCQERQFHFILMMIRDVTTLQTLSILLHTSYICDMHVTICMQRSSWEWLAPMPYHQSQVAL